MASQVSIFKPFVILFGILSMIFTWIITGISASYYYYTFEGYLEWNMFGFITGSNLYTTNEYAGWYNDIMLLAGILYLLGVLVGFCVVKTKSFPYASLISILMIVAGIFIYIGGAVIETNNWYNRIDPYARTIFNMKPFVRVQLGMILGFITLGLLVIEFIIILRKVDAVLFPKREMTASMPERKAVPYQPPIYAQESIETEKYVPNFCPHCGLKIVDQKAKFCSSCGGKLMD